MNESLYNNFEAVKELNRVDGFDPTKVMRRIAEPMEDGTSSERCYLDVAYRKLWFRLKYPQGAIKKFVREITDQFAIVEAKVYLDRSDPADNYIANAIVKRYFNPEDKLADKYLELAETAAVGRALADAGFSIQFADSSESMDPNVVDTLVFRRILPDFDSMKKTILVTHADVDHCGLLPLFDDVLASPRTAECLRNEFMGNDGFREKNPLHKPYINICKILTSYKAVHSDKLTALWNHVDPLREPLTQIGFFDFGELHFEVYEGKGGHLPGEIVLIDYTHHLAFTGDVYINIHGLTPEQAAYSQYAPILMTSVDTDPKLCAEERKAVMQRLGVGGWQIFGAHGFKKEYSVNT